MDRLFPELSSNIDLKSIIDKSSTLKAKIPLKNRYDIIIGLIYLYKSSCSFKDIVFWMKNEWGLEYREEQLIQLDYKFRQRRLFGSKPSLTMIGFNYVEEVMAMGIPIVNTPDNIPVTRYKAELSKYVPPKTALMNELIDSELYDVKQLLKIKRYLYAYNISDLIIIHEYYKRRENKINQHIITSLIESIENTFAFEVSILTDMLCEEC